jgi:hypothetical protein
MSGYFLWCHAGSMVCHAGGRGFKSRLSRHKPLDLLGFLFSSNAASPNFAGKLGLRFTVKNTKAAMNAARMTMVPMPMGEESHLNFTGRNPGASPKTGQSRPA